MIFDIARFPTHGTGRIKQEFIDLMGPAMQADIVHYNNKISSQRFLARRRAAREKLARARAETLAELQVAHGQRTRAQITRDFARFAAL